MCSRCQRAFRTNFSHLGSALLKVSVADASAPIRRKGPVPYQCLCICCCCCTRGTVSALAGRAAEYYIFDQGGLVGVGLGWGWLGWHLGTLHFRPDCGSLRLWFASRWRAVNGLHERGKLVLHAVVSFYCFCAWFLLSKGSMTGWAWPGLWMRLLQRVLWLNLMPRLTGA